MAHGDHGGLCSRFHLELAAMLYVVCSPEECTSSVWMITPTRTIKFSCFTVALSDQVIVYLWCTLFVLLGLVWTQRMCLRNSVSLFLREKKQNKENAAEAEIKGEADSTWPRIFLTSLTSFEELASRRVDAVCWLEFNLDHCCVFHLILSFLSLKKELTISSSHKLISIFSSCQATNL